MSKQGKEEINLFAQEATPKKKSFIDIAREFEFLVRELEEGEFTDELAAKIEANKKDFEDKLRGMYYVIQVCETKINSIYKPEIEKIQAYIKRNETSIVRLKENIMYLVSVFGTDEKIKTDMLNVSIIHKDKVEIAEIDFAQRCEELTSRIMFNVFDDVTDAEQDCMKVNISFNNLTLEQAAKIREILNPAINDDTIPAPDKMDISVDKNKALKILSLVENYNRGAIEHAKYEAKLEGKDTFDVELKDTGFKGVTLGETKYPRFS